MQVVVWIVIILLAVLLVWLLRKWIKRLIFILILLCLAFFIYGIFSPSGASRLWYNIRTFPQRVTSWISSSKEFLDYDSYKLDISSVGAKDEGEDSVEKNDLEDKDNSQKTVKEEDKDGKSNTIQAFPSGGGSASSVTNNSKANNNVDTGYSKNDLIGIIGNYIENNLDDDTDILVTIEYEETASDPDKIILQTQSKASNLHFVSIPRLSIKKISNGLQHSKTQTVTIVSGGDNENGGHTQTVKTGTVEKNNVNKTSTTTTNNTTSKGLTQKEIKETEEIFSILF